MQLSAMQFPQTRKSRFDVGIISAMVVALVVHPLLYTLVTPIIFRGAIVEGFAGRGCWWLLYGWILFWEWMPFGVVWLALRNSRRPWSDVGVDWNYFVRHRTIFVVAILSLVVAFAAPRFLYHGAVPRVSQTYHFLPVTGFERSFYLLAATTGAVCEEVCYRGLPLRLFAGSTFKAWLMLPVTMVAFVFNHGSVEASQDVYYLAWGLLYGGVFILLRRRRLEWLIVAHWLYDILFMLNP
jgi:hypothetical protein